MYKSILIISFSLLPESVRWQASNGQTIKAVKTISRAARWNNVKMPDEFSCLSLNVCYYYLYIDLITNNVYFLILG